VKRPIRILVVALAVSAVNTLAGEGAGDDVQLEALAYEALAAGRAADAENLFVRALQESPQNAEAIAGLGFIRMREWEFAAAEVLFERALEIAPDDELLRSAHQDSRFWGRLKKGDEAAADGRGWEAAAQYRSALEIKLGDPHALERLVKLGPSSAEAAESAQMASSHREVR